MHWDHKLIRLSDIESLKKENITIDSVTKDFNEISEKTINLKNKIENEINKINELYEKILNDLTQSFLIKHEKLIKEENDLKENLQNEVTKIKEKLENYLSESNNEIKISERIKKGIQKMENEENNMIKLLSYVSKINKTQKNMNKLFQNLMKNIKINYEKDKNNIKYEEYYFNGLFIPKNIEFKDVTTSSLNIKWQIDNINIINIDKNKIKYRVEMRKENEKFKSIYEGNNTNYLVNNLIKNTNYEFRICSIYNDLNGEWTEIQKIKTLNYFIDSIILKESKRENEFIEKIIEWTGYNKFELLFRGTRDGMTGTVYHNKCNNQSPTILLYKNENGYINGGYTSFPWSSDDSYHSAPDSFLFTLTNIYNINPTKFPSKNDQYEVYHYSNHGPAFGSGIDLGICNDMLNKGGWSYFPYTYQDSSGKGRSIFTGKDNNNDTEFKIKEIEIFKLYK